MSEQLIQAYQEMADLTAPVCAGQGNIPCRLPHTCCSPEYCAMTMDIALAEWGVVLKPTGHKTLPLMGENGCIAAPHLRPLCTYHTCAINGIGRTRDPEWDKKYFALRTKIDTLEWERRAAREGEADAPD